MCISIDIQILLAIVTHMRREVDCFRYRIKHGRYVALEALRECLRERRFSMDDLWRYAKVRRMTRVMMPYLEAID